MKKALATLAAFFLPLLASAHEVYVLTPGQVQTDIHMPSFNEIAVMWQNISAFTFWGFIAILTVAIVFLISISRVLEDWLDPFFERARKYAAPIARITVGTSFLAAAYYQASFGPELPLLATYGAYTNVITVALIAIGVLMISGIFARVAAFAALVLFAVSIYYHGTYMLTYTNYLGEILVLLILGAHHGMTRRGGESKLAKALAPYSFLILRVFFGISLFFASFYAKILHNNLALQVASLPLAGHAHSIAQVLGFEPHFLVLGAAIIEIVIALFFIFGIEIRFTSIFVLFWLSLSLYWFGESVWPHIILIGIPIAFICYGYDKYSLEGRFFKHGAREPVL